MRDRIHKLGLHPVEFFQVGNIMQTDHQPDTVDLAAGSPVIGSVVSLDFDPLWVGRFAADRQQQVSLGEYILVILPHQDLVTEPKGASGDMVDHHHGAIFRDDDDPVLDLGKYGVELINALLQGSGSSLVFLFYPGL